MSTLPIAAVIAKEATARQARSALPGAPVTPYVEPTSAAPRLSRVREAVAAGLHRVAGAVEPARRSHARQS